jgi:hypothetical protein
MSYPQPRTLLLRLFQAPAFRFVLVLLALGQPVRAELRITEVLATDQAVLADEDGDHSGWVELLNAGPQGVSLHGYGLSDDSDRPFRWSFPAVTLDAGSRLVVFTSGKDRTVPAGPTNGSPAELRPDQIDGLQWWVDAADPATLMVDTGRVVQWQDKSGRRPIDEYPVAQTPGDLPGKVLWLDAADAASLSDNVAVTRWKDLSGTGNDASQPAVDAQPVRVTDAHGLPHLRFDGFNDVLDFPGDVTVRTLVWVGIESPLVANVDRRPLVGHGSRFDFLRGQNRNLLGYHAAVAPGILNAAVYLNGVRVDPLATALPPGLNVVIIAGTGPAVFDNLADDRALPRARWWGEVAEIVGFNRTLTDAEAVGLDRHLRAKWRGVPDAIAPDYSARQNRPEWQPRLVPDSLTRLPAVRFDGVDDRMLFPEIRRAQSIFLVVREDEYATDSYRPFIGHNISSVLTRGTDRLLLYGGSPATWLEGLAVNPLATRPSTRRLLLTFQFGSPVPVDRLGLDRVYDELIFDGDFHEVVLFDRALSETERTSLEAHLSRKWRLPDRRLHANFSLKTSGEAVRLTAPDGRLVDTAPAFASRADCSYGRLGDGPAWGWFDQPTPGRSNSAVGAEFGMTPSPTTTPAAGFLRGATLVELLPATNSPAGTRIYYTLDGSAPVTGPAGSWLDDGLPPGATSGTLNDSQWTWGQTNPLPVSGSRSLQSGTVSGSHQFSVTLVEPLTVGTNGSIHLELWSDPASPPRAVMLQVYSGGSWEHRAFWGEDLLATGLPRPPGHFRAGDLPSPGRWVRLTIAPARLGLTNAAIGGLAFTLFDGRAAFDALGYSEAPLPQLYDGPLSLTQSTVIRARAVAPGQVASESVTASFLIAPAGDLPVVSLSTAPSHLFDEATGIYAGGPEKNADGQARVFNYQRNWERPVHAELFEPDGSLGFSVDCGLKIHGAFSRHWPQKSLRLHFRKRYGVASLQYPVFPGHPVERFDSLILRNGGNDWNSAYLRDELAHSLAADLGLGHQASRPAHVFLNGEYWGVMPLREHADDNTISRQHQIDGELDVVKNEIEVGAGDRQDYQGLVSVAVAAVNDSSRHPLLASRVNATNYWDWLGLELFAGNVDWPGNNMLVWRSRAAGQPWQWMLVDCDGGFYGPWVSVDIVRDMLSERPLIGVPAISLSIMRGLLNNGEYRQQFSRRLNDLLNTTFSAGYTVPRLNLLGAGLTPAMPAQIARWKDSSSFAKPLGSALQNLESWQGEVTQVRQFLQDRPAIFRQHVRSHFNLGPDVVLTVNAEPPTGVRSLRVATLNFGHSQLPWTGTYFAGLSVEISVEPASGFKVVGWSDGAPADSSRVLTPAQAQSLTVLLEPDGTVTPPPFPRPYALAAGEYRFNAWPASTAAGTYPPSMAFETSATQDPGLSAAVTGFWTNRYDLGSRSRIVGLDGDGVSFVNTGNPQTEDDYVTGALLSLDSTGTDVIDVTWTAGTVVANSRDYGLRLQWRIGTNAAFSDVKTSGGQPVEYIRSSTDGHSAILGPVRLPAEAGGQPLIQLRWRYYSIPKAGDSGPRAQLRIDDILVAAAAAVTTPRCVASLSGDTLLVSVTASAGATCGLWVSDDTLSWTEIATDVADASGHLKFTIDLGHAHRFCQVRLR